MTIKATLKVLPDFTCLGGDCPDNCCSGPWAIPVDETTLQRWQALPESSEKQQLMERIDFSNQDMPVLARDHQHTCHHVTGDGLCGLQVQHGADFLPAICRDYPRIQFTTGNRQLRSAYLSCPEMARLFFSQGQTGVFLWDGADRSRMVTNSIEDHLDKLLAKVLQDERYPLNVQLGYLARCMGDIARQVQENRMSTSYLEQQLEHYEPGIAEQAQQADALPESIDNGSLAWFWSKVFMAHRQFFDLYSDTEFDKDPLIQQLKRCAESDQGWPDAMTLLLEYRQQARDAMQPLDADLRRLLYASLMNKGFPWAPMFGNFIATFLRAALPMSFLRLLFWVRLQQRNELPHNELIDLVCRVERVATHNDAIMAVFEDERIFDLGNYQDCLLV